MREQEGPISRCTRPVCDVQAELPSLLAILVSRCLIFPCNIASVLRSSNRAFCSVVFLSFLLNYEERGKE